MQYFSTVFIYTLETAHYVVKRGILHSAWNYKQDFDLVLLYTLLNRVRITKQQA